MMKWLIAFVIAGSTFGVLDAIWLTWAGPNLYKPVIGEIMSESFRLLPAILFYLIYLMGMLWFAIKPALRSRRLKDAIVNGAILGAICYSTFDLTSQAVFKVWASHITIIDIIWGTIVTSVSAVVSSYFALKLIR